MGLKCLTFAEDIHLAEISSPAEMIDQIMDAMYDDYLVSHYDNSSLRREDIKGMANFASQYETIEAFLTDLALGDDFI